MIFIFYYYTVMLYSAMSYSAMSYSAMQNILYNIILMQNILFRHAKYALFNLCFINFVVKVVFYYQYGHLPALAPSLTPSMA